MIPLYDDQHTVRTPVLTVGIIILNFIVFAFWQQSVGLEESVDLAAFIPTELTHQVPGAGFRLFTAMFMHGSWLHLIGNMWFLWIFGNNIEDACGSFRFLLFYLICGVIATVLHTLAAPNSIVPLVGASGAVSGILGAYLLKHPRAYIRTLIPIWIFFRIVNLPAYLFLLFWIAMQLLAQASSRVGAERGGVAHLAHIGGFFAGVILIFFFQKYGARPSRRAPLAEW